MLTNFISIGMETKTGNLFIILILLMATSCWQQGPNHLSCKDELELILIKKDAERGGWMLGNKEENFLWAGTKPYDMSICDSIEVRIAPFGREVDCNISDIYPPFEVYKRANTDSLIVLKDGKKIVFRISDEFCK